MPITHVPVAPAPTQAGAFTDGAYYGRKVRVPSSSMHFSAWFRADGTLQDAEGWDRIRRCRPARRHSAVWYELEGQSEKIRKLAFPHGAADARDH